MVTIELPDDTAALLEANAAAAGLDLASYLARFAVVPPPVDASKLSIEERLKAWRRYVDSIPPSDHFVDDSRESIYPDRS